jgi:hypothetical protein
MKIVIRTLVIVVVAIGQLSVSPAQMGMGRGMQPPDIAGVFNPNVGSGAAYEMAKKEGNEKTNFEIAVVDKDASGAYWIEYTIQNPKMNGTMYMKTLLARQTDDVIVQKTIVQVPGRPPMDVSSMMAMHGMQSAKSKADIRADAEDLGTEDVTTPAGTFSCQHWRSRKDGTEVWLADKVSPWKLVKAVGPNSTMTLVRTISNAKTHINGTPIGMEEMMQQHMKNPQ